jgi:uncharacterized protein YqgC (DUF456 family)
MEVILLAAVLVACLFLIPIGLPGLWAMLGVALLFDWLVEPRIGIWAVVAGAVVALFAELLEYSLSARFARRFGGSRRAEWGAVIGGLIGAVVGVPVPIVGSMVGAFAGAFAGALVGELSRGSGTRISGRAAWGAFLGRIAATVVKVALGCALAAWLVFIAWT